LAAVEKFDRLKTVGPYLELVGLLTYCTSISHALRPLTGMLSALVPAKYRSDPSLYDTVVSFSDKYFATYLSKICGYVCNMPPVRYVIQGPSY